MKQLDNSAKNIGANVEPKEEERGLLSSNTADVRSSSLGFNPNDEYASEDMTLRYLANILAKAYFDHKKHECISTDIEKARSYLLQGVNERSS